MSEENNKIVPDIASFGAAGGNKARLFGKKRVAPSLQNQIEIQDAPTDIELSQKKLPDFNI